MGASEPLGLVPFYPVAEQAYGWVRRVFARNNIIRFFAPLFLLFAKGSATLAAQYGLGPFPSHRRIRAPRSRSCAPWFGLEYRPGSLKPRFIRSFEGWTISPEEGRYSLSFLTAIFALAAFVTAFYIGTFTDTQPQLAFKAGLLLGIGAFSGAMMALFFPMMASYKEKDMILVFNKEIPGKAVSTGFIVFAFLVLGQLWIFTGLPPFPSIFEAAGVVVLLLWLLWGDHPGEHARTKAYASGFIFLVALLLTAYYQYRGVASLLQGVSLSSFAYQQAYQGVAASSVSTANLDTTHVFQGGLFNSLSSLFPYAGPEPATALAVTISPDPQLVGLFYTTSAVIESFAFQGFEYTLLVYGLAGFDPDNITWGKHIWANLVTTLTAGLLHFAVYSLNVEATGAVMLGFALLNFAYQVTGSIDVIITSHVALNLVSSLSGSAFSVTSSAMIISPAVIIGVSFALLPIFLFHMRARGYIRTVPWLS
ncbi:MAG: hypothetical protein KGI38_11455 [Thaumarchaeota archaeon]|nr:hypothetical protein [Nitrososphaerota archaeon]